MMAVRVHLVRRRILSANVDFDEGTWHASRVDVFVETGDEARFDFESLQARNTADRQCYGK